MSKHLKEEVILLYRLRRIRPLITISFNPLDESMADYKTFVLPITHHREGYQAPHQSTFQALKKRIEEEGQNRIYTWVIVPEGKDVSRLCENSMEDPPPDARHHHLEDRNIGFLMKCEKPDVEKMHLNALCSNLGKTHPCNSEVLLRSWDNSLSI